MGERKKVPSDVATQVLTACRRRCCICVALQRDVGEKKGQIAHLDHDPSNNAPDNLVFLCLEHHDQYDSTPSQSKALTMAEVKQYRTALLEFGIQQAGTSPSPPPSQQINAAVYLGNVQISGPNAVNVVGPDAIKITGPVVGTVSSGEPQWRPPFYFLADDPVPLCARCWEVDQRKVHLTGPFRVTGWRWDCPQCKNDYVVQDRVPRGGGVV